MSRNDGVDSLQALVSAAIVIGGLYGMSAAGPEAYQATGNGWLGLAAADAAARVYGTGGAILGMGAAAVVAGTAVFVTSLSDVPIRWKLDKFVDRNPQFKERYNDLLDLHKSLNREYRYKSGLFTVINLLGKNKFHSVDFDEFKRFSHKVLSTYDSKSVVDKEIVYGKGLKTYSEAIVKLQKDNNVSQCFNQGEIEHMYEMYVNIGPLRKFLSPENVYDGSKADDVRKLYNKLQYTSHDIYVGELNEDCRNSIVMTDTNKKNDKYHKMVRIDLNGKSYELGRCFIDSYKEYPDRYSRGIEYDKISFKVENLKQGSCQGAGVHAEFLNDLYKSKREFDKGDKNFCDTYNKAKEESRILKNDKLVDLIPTIDKIVEEKMQKGSRAM